MPVVSRLNNGSYNAQSLRSYIATAVFNDSFYSYTVVQDGNQTVGTIGPVSGASSNNCLKGRILRETGRKLYPGANVGVTNYLVGVYDSVTLLNGFIDPNACVFAVFNTDKPNYIPDNGDKGPSVYTCGTIEADGDVTIGGNITISGDAVVENLTVNDHFVVGSIFLPIIAQNIQPRDFGELIPAYVDMSGGNLDATGTITCTDERVANTFLVGETAPVFSPMEVGPRNGILPYVYAENGNVWVSSTLTAAYLAVENLADVATFHVGDNVDYVDISGGNLDATGTITCTNERVANTLLVGETAPVFSPMEVGPRNGILPYVYAENGNVWASSTLTTAYLVVENVAHVTELHVGDCAAVDHVIISGGNITATNAISANSYSITGSTLQGIATLSSGSVTVTDITCSPSSSIIVTVNTAVDPGAYYVLVGTNTITITSTSSIDGSTVNWLVLN